MEKKFQSQTVTLPLIGQCPMSNSSEDFSYPTIYSNFKILDHLFFELSCLQTDRQTDRQRRQVPYTCDLNRKYNKKYMYIHLTPGRSFPDSYTVNVTTLLSMEWFRYFGTQIVLGLCTIREDTFKFSLHCAIAWFQANITLALKYIEWL